LSAKKLHLVCLGTFDLQAWKVEDGQTQFFCALPPTFDAKKLEAECKKITLGMSWNFQALSLEACREDQTQFFYALPPTFGAKSWRPSVKKLYLACLGAFELVV